MVFPQSKNLPDEEWHELCKLENECYCLYLYAAKDFLECWAYAEMFAVSPHRHYQQKCVAQFKTGEIIYPLGNECENNKNTGVESTYMCCISDTFSVLKPHELMSILKAVGIRGAIDYNALYEFCAALSSGLDPSPTVIVRGTPPQRGGDGWLDVRVKMPGSGIKLLEDVHGFVDHKKLHRFSEIEPGQKLAIVRSPGSGNPGMSVLGEPIAAEKGSPYTLNAGEGVRLKYDNRVAFATKAGKAVLEGNTLKVVDFLKINRDIDLSIGDINFNGVVEISGEIPDDFDVKASKGLYVQGIAGACQIESGGDIEIKSMFGKNIGTIICHGTLKAQYLNQVNVYCYGDVLIDREIRYCKIKSTGSVKVESGSIIGGSCVALGGIEAQNIGAPDAPRTEVVSGVYFPHEDRLLYLRRRRQHIGQQLKSINEAIEPLKLMIRNKPLLADSARKRLEILEKQLIKLQEDKIRTRAELKTSGIKQPDGINHKINVHKVLYEGVEIRLGNIRETVSRDYSGPLSIILNSAENDIVLH